MKICIVCKKEWMNQGEYCPECGFPTAELHFFSTEHFHRWNRAVVIPYRRQWEQEKLVYQLKEELSAVKQLLQEVQTALEQQKERFDHEQEELAAVRQELEMLKQKHVEPVKHAKPVQKEKPAAAREEPAEKKEKKPAMRLFIAPDLI
ncbi:MAG: hypothetical protein ACI3XW_07275 [Butyricicoccus sp.]